MSFLLPDLFPAKAQFARRLSQLVTLSSLAFLSHFAYAAKETANTPLSLQAAQGIALERSLQLKAQDAMVNASFEMAKAASQLPDPTLKLGIDNLPIQGANRWSLNREEMTMRRVGLMQEITNSEKRQSKSALYLREADKNQATKTLAAAGVKRDSGFAWLEQYYLRKMRTLVEAQMEHANHEVTAIETAYRAGRGNQADIFLARGEKFNLENRLSELRTRVNKSQILLARWVGDEVERNLAERTPVVEFELTTTQIETRIAAHAQLRVLEQQEAISQAQIQLATANKKADWSVELTLQQRGSAYGNMISVGLSRPLQWDQAKRQDRELAARIANLEADQAMRQEAQREMNATAQAVFIAWKNSRERLQNFQETQLSLSQDRVTASLAAYRGAKMTLNELMMARRNALEVGLQQLQLEWDTAKLELELDYFLGADLVHYASVGKDHLVGEAK